MNSAVAGWSSLLNDHWIKLIDSAIQVSYILTGFCLLDLSTTEKRVLKSVTAIVGYLFLFAVPSVFASCILMLLVGAYMFRIVTCSW